MSDNFLFADEAWEAHKLGKSIHPDKNVPTPICLNRWKGGDGKFYKCTRETGYWKEQYKGQEKQWALILHLGGMENYFIIEDKILLLLEWCPRCQGYSDGVLGNRKGKFGLPAHMQSAYDMAHDSGTETRMRGRERQQNTDIEKEARIKVAVAERDKKLADKISEIKGEVFPHSRG